MQIHAYTYTQTSTHIHTFKQVHIYTSWFGHKPFGASCKATKRVDETKWKGRGLSSPWGKFWFMQDGNNLGR